MSPPTSGMLSLTSAFFMSSIVITQFPFTSKTWAIYSPAWQYYSGI